MASSSESTSNKQNIEFELKLLNALCNRLILIGELKSADDFLDNYPKENLADVHNNETGAFYLMTGDKPLKLVEYNLNTLEVIELG